VCVLHCAQLLHTVLHRTDFSSYPPDNHHCSDDVYLREGGVVVVVVVEMNIIYVALSHCCCRTTVQCQLQAVCNSQYMVTDQHWATGEQYIVRSHQGTTTGTERSWVLGGRREERTRSECVVVGRSMPVRQPLRITDHRESNDAWMVPVGLTSRRNGGVDMCHG